MYLQEVVLAHAQCIASSMASQKQFARIVSDFFASQLLNSIPEYDGESVQL